MKLSNKQSITAICLALAIGTLTLYFPILRDAFLNYDDNSYITENSHIQGGVTWSAIVWAFKTGYAANWHPLTWISHMIDFQLFGLNPAGHHLMNLLFHSANTVLLFVLMNYMTRALWRSAFAAALFAWHPLHVESVAWASERKDVLSAFFWMLTLLCYARYARSRIQSPESTVPNPQSAIRNPQYWLSLLFFACGLMSKPMVVTLPFVLLLLDFWPFQRFNILTFQCLLIEKLPFFALSLAGSVATYLVQRHGGAVTADPLSFRIENALWAYQEYIVKSVWPANLAVVYPFTKHGLTRLAVESLLLLLLCSTLFISLMPRRPYLFVGWFLFLGMLVPVVGIVQVGSSAMADRYMYLPGIGLFIIVAWVMADLAQSPGGKPFFAAAALASLIACLVLSWRQIGYWRNSITLFSHDVAVTTDNYVASACLGQAYYLAGDINNAVIYCHDAVRIDPDYPGGQFFLGQALWKSGHLSQALVHLNAAAQLTPHDSGFQYNLGKFLLEHGKTDDAIARFKAALDNDPDFPEAHNALGKAFLKQGQLQKAADQLSQAVTLEPSDPQFHYDFGTVLLNESQLEQAIEQFSEAVRLKPDFASAHGNLAVALASQGKLADAIPEFAQVAQLQPNDAEARFNLGFAYLNNRQPDKAAEQFSEEVRLTPNEPKAHYRLAQALSEQNQWSQAVTEYRKTLALAPNFADAKKELDEILAAHSQLR